MTDIQGAGIMSTVEDFENAPVGATATYSDGSRAVKMGDGEWGWVTPARFYYDDEEMVQWGYSLDHIEPAPTTAREALDLAWELAHKVKEGQVIPKGTRFLENRASGMKGYAASRDTKVSDELVYEVRTLEPLPDPEPDWLDALVVLARHVKAEPDSPPTLWANLGGGLWGHVETTKRATTRELRDVTPLYPKEAEE